MLQVIQTIKLKFTTILHRGHEEYSSDPYSNLKNSHRNIVGTSEMAFGAGDVSARCSSTLHHYIKNNRNIRIAGISASFALLIISALTIYPIVKSNYSAGTATAATTVLNMTSSASANLNLVVKSSDGTFAASSENDLAKFGITTNNFTGYTLSITGPENNDLTNDNTEKVFTSIDHILDAQSFTNGSGDLYNGKYGYFPSKYNSSVNTYFRPAPTETATTLDVTSEANNESNNYTIGLGARADYDTPNGTYSNTFTLNLVGNPVSYAITYADNSGDSEVSNLPEATTGKTTDLSIPITEDAPTRPGYALSKWCLGEVTDEGVTCNGVEYAPGADFEIDQTTQNVTTLYAVWVESYEGYLQEFTAAECAAMDVQTTKILRDNRDNQDYNIAKLADGNCWMDNLNLGDTDNYPLVSDLTSDNTNLSETVEKATFNSWKVSSGTQTYDAGEYIPLNKNNTSNGLDTDPTSDTKYGTLYNYYAASAGTIKGSSNSVNATYDICPKGWRLPTGGSSGEFQTLYNNSSYNSNAKMRASIANGGAAFALAGYFSAYAPTGQGSNGYYWSFTRSDTIRMYTLDLNTSGVYPTDYSLRYIGYSMRCVKKDPLEEANLGTMQEIGKLSASEKSALLDSMPTGAAYNITDSRDNQVYKIAKLADGNIWLLDNLRLGASTLVETLSTSNANMSSTTAFTLPSSGSVNSYTTAQLNTSSVNTINDNTSLNYGDGSHKYGVYYNFCAASAGTYCYAEGSGVGNASYDICPNGWRMPNGGDTGEYQILYASYLSDKVSFFNALSAPFSGRIDNNSISFRGSNGFFWSSTQYDGTIMYQLYTHPTAMYPAAKNGQRYLGMSVRCLMDNTMADAGVETLQDLGNLSVSDKTALLAKMPTGTSYTLTDSRDGQEYAVAKLADGNIWLLDNLRLGAAELKEELSVTNTNMDPNTPFTLPASTSTASDSMTDARINTDYANTTTTSYGVGSGKIGTYFNYCAASAGTYCYANGSGTGNASYDVCPAGWRMPTGGSSGEYQALYTAYSSNAANFRTALSTPLSGNLYSGSPYNQGNRGFFWSSTRHDGGTMYQPRLDSSSVEPTYYSSRDFGYSVRCIVEQRTIANVTNMQDVTAKVVENTTDLATATLTDTRDSQTYSAVKYGNLLWMTRNLAIGCNGSGSSYGSSVSSKSLSSANSNVSTTWSTPTALLSDASSSTATADYTTPRMQCSSTYGAWYNYAAASASTITDEYNTDEAQYSICPRGWRLFTSTERITSTDFEDYFYPVTGGYYAYGKVTNVITGYWWSSTSDVNNSGKARYGLYYYHSDSNDHSYMLDTSVTRYASTYVRCVASS